VGWEGSVTKADPVALDAKEKSAGFVVGIRAPIDDDAVSWMEWGENFIQLEPVRASAGDFARKRPTFLSEAGVDELLMIDPVEPS
jgi:hypothetical protein